MCKFSRRAALAMLMSLATTAADARPVALDSRYTLSVRSTDTRAFALGVDPRGTIFAVTGLRPDDQLVRVGADGVTETVLDRLGCGVGALTNLELGFDGRWFTTAGSEVAPEARGVVTFDARMGAAGMFSRGKVDSSDGRLSFDPWTRTMLMVNSSSRDLIEIDRQGRRRVLVPRVATNPCGVAVTSNGSAVVLDRSGKLIAVNRVGRAARPMLDLAAILPGHFFLSVKCDITSQTLWFLGCDGEVTTLYRMPLETLEPEPMVAGEELIGLCLGPAKVESTTTAAYVSSPGSSRIFEISPALSKPVAFSTFDLLQGHVATRVTLGEATDRARKARAMLGQARSAAALRFEESAVFAQLVGECRTIAFQIQNVSESNSASSFVDFKSFGRSASKLMSLRSRLASSRAEAVSNDTEVQSAEDTYVVADIERQSVELEVRNRLAGQFTEIRLKVAAARLADDTAVNADPVQRGVRDGIVAFGMSRAQVEAIARRAGCAVGGELVAASVDGNFRVVWKMPGGVDIINIRQRSSEPYELCGDFRDDKLVSFMKVKP